MYLARLARLLPLVFVLAHCEKASKIASTVGTTLLVNTDMKKATPRSSTSLEMAGIKSKGLGIWVEFDGQVAGQLLAPDDTQLFTVTVTLKTGDNVFKLRGGTSDDNLVAETEVYTIVVDNEAPAKPVVTDYDAFVDLNLTAEATISGTKGADCLLYNGVNKTTASGPDTTFTLSVPVESGTNTFSLTCKDTLLNTSDAVEVVIVGTNLSAPTLNPVTSPAKVGQQTLSGTKSADVGLMVSVSRDGAAPSLTAKDSDSETTWQHVLDFGDVEGIYTIEVWATQGEARSASARATIIYDTQAPPTPVLGPEVVDGKLAAITNTPTLTGTAEGGTTLCVGVRDSGICMASTTVNADESWSVTLDVTDLSGATTLCATATDLAGNVSPEACFIAEFVGPGITILWPRRGAIISGDALEVDLRLTAKIGHAIDVASIQVCLDSTCDAPSAHADGGGRYVLSGDDAFDLTSLTARTHHTVSVAASTSGDSPATSKKSVRFFYAGSADSAEIAALISETGVAKRSVKPRIAAANDGSIHMVWEDDCSADAGCTLSAGYTLTLTGYSINNPDILYRRYAEDGTWSDIVLISNVEGDGVSSNPDVAVDSEGVAHIVWEEKGRMKSVCGSGNGCGDDPDLYHRTYDPSTGALGAITYVNTTAKTDIGGVGDDTIPRVAVDNAGGVHVVWKSNTDQPVINYASWKGSAWSAPVAVSGGSVSNTNPAIAVASSGHPHVVWDAKATSSSDRDIYYRAREGTSWGAIVAVSELSGSGETTTAAFFQGSSIKPAIALDAANRPHIVWEDDATFVSPGSINEKDKVMAGPDSCADPDKDVFARKFWGSDKGAAHQLVSEQDAATIAGAEDCDGILSEASRASTGPAIAIRGDHIAVTYSQVTPAGTSVYLATGGVSVHSDPPPAAIAGPVLRPVLSAAMSASSSSVAIGTDGAVFVLWTDASKHPYEESAGTTDDDIFFHSPRVTWE